MSGLGAFKPRSSIRMAPRSSAQRAGLQPGQRFPNRSRARMTTGIMGMDAVVGEGGGQETNSIADSVVEKIYSGSYANSLKQAHADIRSQLATLNEARSKALNMSDQALVSRIATARNNVLDASMKVTAAQNQYNLVVRELQRLGLSISELSLSGLVLLPPFLIIMVMAFSSAFNVAISAVSGGRNVVDSIADSIRALGGVIKNVAVPISAVGDTWLKVAAAAAIGTVIYFVVTMKRGRR